MSCGREGVIHGCDFELPYNSLMQFLQCVLISHFLFYFFPFFFDDLLVGFGSSLRSKLHGNSTEKLRKINITTEIFCWRFAGLASLLRVSPNSFVKAEHGMGYT